ncbi:MAG: transposase family protein [Candidatus Lambdaproteobacteria bacterium]|nr:transposase family protein [Candidatus Lambdaproteobacteria bacterium]
MVTKQIEHLERIKDPRQLTGRRHLLADVLVIGLCAVICGADGWQAMAAFGRAKRKWFKSFLSLP